MDKEIEKIDCELWKNDYYQGLGDDRMFDYRDKVILRYGKLIGYRKPKEKPPVVCLCGSTRFVDYYNEYRKKLTLEGKIVLGIELVIPQSEAEDPQHSNYTVKQRLDELHLRKIDLADEVFVLNVGGYIGESTRNEIEYAQRQGKRITYLEKPPFSVGCGGDS